MHDADGPGAIVRMWAAWHGPHGGPFSDGTFRIYIFELAAPFRQGQESWFGVEPLPAKQSTTPD